MINHKTVIVVGAGASCDLGLPLGPGLQKNISQMLQSEGNRLMDYYRDALNRHFADPTLATKALSKAKNSAQQILAAASIDNFMDQRKDDKELITALKMAIAFQIASAENSCSLSGREYGSIIMNNKNYFLFEFLKTVMRGHQIDNVGNSLRNLTFVIFNYDRCVERYFDIWFHFNDFPPLHIDQQPSFIHVYGSLGDYFSSQSPNPFEHTGTTPLLNPHIELADSPSQIRTFTEQDDAYTKQRICEAIDECKALIFLGFGFEEQNMRFFESSSRNKKVFATTYGLGLSNTKFISRKLCERYTSSRDDLHCVDGKACDLLSDRYQAITSAVGSLS